MLPKRCLWKLLATLEILTRESLQGRPLISTLDMVLVGDRRISTLHIAWEHEVGAYVILQRTYTRVMVKARWNGIHAWLVIYRNMWMDRSSFNKGKQDNIYIVVYVYICIYIYVYIYIYKCLSLSLSLFLSFSLYKYMYVYMHNIYIYVCIL